MTAISWSSAASGDWSSVTDWSPAAIPGADDDVTIAATGTAYTVTISDAEAANTVALNDAAASLDITGTLTLDGMTSLASGELLLERSGGAIGTLKGGTVDVTGGQFVVSTGVLDGVTCEGTLDLSTSESLVEVSDGITLAGIDGNGRGTILLNGYSADLRIDNTTTLDNAFVSFSNYAELVDADTTGTGAVLTLGSKLVLTLTGPSLSAYVSLWASGGVNDSIVNQGTIIAGIVGFVEVHGYNFTNQGSISISNGASFAVETTSFVNSGTVTVTNGGILTLGFNSNPFIWSNTGVISETNGSLTLLGDMTRDQLNSIVRSGGTVAIGGTVDNSGGTLQVGAGTALGTLDFYGTISNGTIHDAGSGFVFGGDALLDGVTYQGVLDLSSGTEGLRLQNGITLTGTDGNGPGVIDLTGGILDTLGTMALDNATVNVGNPGANMDAGDLTLGSNLVMTLVGTGADFTVYGSDLANQGSIIAGVAGGYFEISTSNSFSNQGTISVSNGDTFLIDQGTFTNSGTLTVTNGGTLALEKPFYNFPFSWSNTGVISETDSTLNLGGNFDRVQLETINHSGGTIAITGTLDNTGGALEVGAGSVLGTLFLSGAIQNGTIHDAGSGIVFENGATLDGVTYQGEIDLFAANAYLPYTIVQVIDGITLMGTGGSGPGVINLNAGNLIFDSTATLDNATINIGNNINGAVLAVSDLISSTVTLTLGADLNIVHSAPFAQVVTGAGTTQCIINEGTINAGFSHGTLIISKDGLFINDGLVVASNGDTLEIDQDVTNSGTILVQDAAIDVSGSTTGSGLVDIGLNGYLEADGAVVGQTVNFTAVQGTLELGAPASESSTITGFNGVDAIDLLNTVPESLSYVTQTSNAGVLTVNGTSGVLATLSFTGSYLASDFHLQPDGNGGTDIVLCLKQGTRIKIIAGWQTVERVKVGDVVIAASGQQRLVQWVGRRQVNLREHPCPQKVCPVRVVQNAFGYGVPSSDVLLSPDHAVFVDDVLIPVKYLANGSSIRQEFHHSEITYYHVELDRHDVLVADGLAVESYLDTGGRSAFVNGGCITSLHPDFNVRAWEANGCAPLVVTGRIVDLVRQRVLEGAMDGRAALYGRAAPAVLDVPKHPHPRRSAPRPLPQAGEVYGGRAVENGLDDAVCLQCVDLRG